MTLIRFITDHIAYLKIVEVLAVCFQDDTGRLLWFIDEPPPSGYLNIDHAAGSIDPYGTNIKVHEQHVDGRIDHAIM
jgi:hypothetical protein